MKRRTALSFSLDNDQKKLLMEHKIWMFDDLSKSEKNAITNELNLGEVVENPIRLIKRKTDNTINYRSGYETLDKYVSPYIGGVLTEICGLPGAGKTILCLKYAANLPKNKTTLWIDTEGCLYKPEGLESIQYLRVFDPLELFSVVKKIRKYLDDSSNEIGLIVIDSLAAHLRGQTNDDVAVRTCMIWDLIKTLRTVACEYGIAVLYTNHMKYVKLKGYVRTLGDSFNHAPTHCLEIKNVSNRYRKLIILKSPCIPRTDINFLTE